MIAQAPNNSTSERSLQSRLKALASAFLWPYRWRMAAALAAMLAQSVLLLPLPYWQGWLIDQLRAATSLPPDQRDRLARQVIVVAVISAAFLLTRMALSWLSGWLMNGVSLQFVRALTDSLHRKLQRLPLAYFERQETGDLMARLTNDVGTLLIFLSAGSLQLVADLILAVGITCGLICISWRLAFLSLVALPLFFWNHRRSASRIWELSRGVQEKTAALYATLSERISAIRTVRSLGTERRELARFGDQLDQHYEYGRSSLRATSLQSAAAMLIGGLATAGLVFVAAWFVHRGTITTGQGVAFVAYIGLLYQPLVRLTQFYGGIAATLAAVDRITELLEEPEQLSGRRQLLPRRTRGAMLLENVAFRYGQDAPLALANVNLTIAPGSTVGIWGPSGAGKSTLLSLLPRLIDLPPDGGRILLDGRDIRSLNGAELRQSVMLVPQHARLFEGTIRYNLTYAARDAHESLVRRALEAVDLHHLIDSLPQGLETWVGERGVSLSGGQRQRLALARALIARPPVLLLDDCTSALDARTEAAVRARIGEFRPGQTRLVVSHKLESLMAADWLVVLDRGRVVWQGEPNNSPAGDLSRLWAIAAAVPTAAKG